MASGGGGGGGQFGHGHLAAPRREKGQAPWLRTVFQADPDWAVLGSGHISLRVRRLGLKS